MRTGYIYDGTLIASVFVLLLSLGAGVMASEGELNTGSFPASSTVIYSTDGGLGEGYVGRARKKCPPRYVKPLDDTFLNEGYSPEPQAERPSDVSTVLNAAIGELGQGYVGRPHKKSAPRNVEPFDDTFLNDGYAAGEQQVPASTVIYTTGEARSASVVMAASDEDFLELDDEFDDEDVAAVADPLEGFNRAMFLVNDKLYFYVLRPAALGYSKVMPEPGRVAVRRFFDNIFMPIRFANNVLQFKFKYAGIELERFVINSTVGVAGFMDPAKSRWNLEPHEEDFGQTLGYYGFGPGMYINLPFFGPSNVRDVLGMVADIFTNPMSYILPHDREIVIGIDLYRRVNEASLDIGLYEDIKRDALDPYIFIRNAYHQHRESLIKE